MPEPKKPVTQPALPSFVLHLCVTAANTSLQPRGFDGRRLEIGGRPISDELAIRLRRELDAFVVDPPAFRKRHHAAAARLVSKILVHTTLALNADGHLEHRHVYDLPDDDAVVGLCIAYLCDPRFAGVRRCKLEECGQFFFRSGKRLYCSDRCSEIGDSARAAGIRVPRSRARAARAARTQSRKPK